MILRHSRPEYVPAHGHYVNPPGTRPAAPWVLVVFGLAVLVAALVAAFFLVRGFEPTSPRTPAPDWVTPSTYGPPPATTGAGR